MSSEAMDWAVAEQTRCNLEPIDRQVLICLAHHHDARTDECSLTYDEIAEFAGCCRRRAIIAIDKLISLRLIQKERCRLRQRQAGNRYFLFGARPRLVWVHKKAL